MMEINQILLNSFARSMSKLEDCYTFLSKLSVRERDEYVSTANKTAAEIEKRINSEDTKKAILTLFNFQWASRFGFKIHKIERFLQSGSSRHYLDNIERTLKLSNEERYKLSDFTYKDYSFNDFWIFIEPLLQRIDFYALAQLSCDELFNIRFPTKESQKFEDWISSVGLLEESWKWEYENKIEEEKRRWFSSKKEIAEITEKWNQRKIQINSFIKYIQNHYPYLYTSKRYIEQLKTSELHMSLDVINLNKAHKALQEGTKLKHLLLEESVTNTNLARSILR